MIAEAGPADKRARLALGTGSRPTANQ